MGTGSGGDEAYFGKWLPQIWHNRPGHGYLAWGADETRRGLGRLGDRIFGTGGPKSQEELIADWESSPQQWGNTEAWLAADPRRIASSRDGWNVGANSQQRMADLMRAARMPIDRQDARSLQPNDPRSGRIGGAFGAPPVDPNQSGQFTPGYTPTPPPPTIDELYAQLYEMKKGTAQGTYDSIADWASGKQKTGARQLGDYRGRLGAQFDEQDAGRQADTDRIYNAGDAASGVAPSGQLVDNFLDRGSQISSDFDTGSARLAELGIDPGSFMDGPGDTQGSLLANQINGAAQYSETLGQIGNEAARFRRGRAEEGISEAERNLSSNLSDVLFIAQQNLDNSLAGINEAALMRTISKAEAAELVQQTQADSEAIAQFAMTSPEAVDAFMEMGEIPAMLSYIKWVSEGADQGGMSASPFDLNEDGTPVLMQDENILTKIEIQTAINDYVAQFGENAALNAFPAWYASQQ